MQERYWKMMTQLKYDYYYLEGHFSLSVNIDRGLKIFLIFCSCSSIASWAIWSEYVFVYAIIIAASQVFQIVNEFLPYKSRIDEIRRYSTKLECIYSQIEKMWFEVAEGNLSNENVNDLIYEFKDDISIINKEFLMIDSLPDIKKISDKADRLKNLYYTNNF